VLDDDDLADGVRLACQSLPVSDAVKVTYSG
jgi:3-ketosteroid 9alpha-monooxygenase subunit B